jgi:hypothetical protein
MKFAEKYERHRETSENSFFVKINEDQFRILVFLFFEIYIYMTAIGLTPGGSSIAHIYTQTVHRVQRTEHT